MGFFSKLLGVLPKQQPLHLNDENFEREVLRSTVPVIVDVWGARCSHCKRLEPILMEIAAQYQGRVKVCEISAEGAPRTMQRLEIQSTPTVLYFRAGRERERVSGFRGNVYFEQTIHELFGIDP